MEENRLQQAVEVLRRLSPENQEYLMAMVRVARAAEEGVKRQHPDSPPETPHRPA